jgi:hypothetical protein
MKMRKVLHRMLLVTLLSSIAWVVSYGQAALLVLILGDRVATENFHLSIDGALNIASLPNFENGKTNIGLNFGLGTHIKLGEKWHLKPEFKPLSQKGAIIIDPITALPPEIQSDKTKIRLNYIEIPVLLQYNISPGFFVSAGPQLSILSAAQQFTKGKISGGAETLLKIDIESYFNKYDVSFPVELGYSLHLSTKKSATKTDVNIFARYVYGLTDVFKDPAVGSSHNSTFQIGISLPFVKTPEEMAKTQKAP